MRDLYHNLLVEPMIDPDEYAGDAKVGDHIIDLQGFEGALIIVQAGDITAGGTFELKEGDAADLSDAAAVADGDLLGTESVFANDDDNKAKSFGYVGTKRYIRLDFKTAGWNGDFGAVAVKGFARHAPVV